MNRGVSFQHKKTLVSSVFKKYLTKYILCIQKFSFSSLLSLCNTPFQAQAKKELSSHVKTKAKHGKKMAKLIRKIDIQLFLIYVSNVFDYYFVFLILCWFIISIVCYFVFIIPFFCIFIRD